MEPKITDIKYFLINNQSVSIEWSDTETGFVFRLAMGHKKGEWTGYTGLATLKVGNKTWYAGTAYWKGVLPVDTVFTIQEGKPC